MSAKYVHLNGKCVPSADAAIGVSDSGFLHGASAFTTMMARGGVVFRLAAHLERLMGTVERLCLRTEATAETLTTGVYGLLDANGLSDARVRVTLTPGSVLGGEPTVVITADQLPDYPAEWYEKGISVAVSEFRQSADTLTGGLKIGCYFPRILAMRTAAAKGAREAVWFTPAGYLAEACFCNIFLVSGGELLTPPLDTPVLDGIVRRAVLDLAGEMGIACSDDRGVTGNELLDADEVFLTASCSGVRPVVRIEDRDIADGKVGPVTKRIIKAYADAVVAECSAPRPGSSRQARDLPAGQGGRTEQEE